MAYVKQIRANPDYLFLAIIAKNDNKHIGNIKLGPINRHHKYADVGIIIGDKTFWGKGYATEAIKLVVAYAFEVLKLHKLTAGAYMNNAGSVKIFKKAGFSIEGLRKRQYLYKGRYVDAVLFGIFRK
jgi:RimJ/RimL family protein N-acetyltransferase